MEPTRYHTVAGHRLAYHRRGAGPLLLCLHGITTYSFIWRRLWPSLTAATDCTALDLLGCGDSDKEAPDLGIATQARLVAGFIEALELAPVHLVTHDVGGGVGQILAVRRPELLASLTLINPVGYDYWPVQPIVSLRVPILRQIAMAALDSGMLRMIVRHGLYHKERADAELLALFRRPLTDRAGRAAFLRFAKCLNNGDLMAIAAELRYLPVATLVVRGDADPYLGPEITERLARELPDCRFLRVATGGHFIQEDEPQLLADAILEHVAAHG